MPGVIAQRDRLSAGIPQAAAPEEAEEPEGGEEDPVAGRRAGPGVNEQGQGTLSA